MSVSDNLQKTLIFFAFYYIPNAVVRKNCERKTKYPQLTTSKNCKSGHLRPKLFEASRNVYQKMKFFGLTSLLDLLVAEDYSNYGSRLLSFLVWCTVFYKPLLSSCILKEKKRFKLFNFFSSSGTRTPECFYYLLEFFVLKYSMFFQFVMQH